MKELEVLSLPLNGKTLVEANAGTGKTWSVSGIYLRLLLETELEVEQILVMTFTRAATAELKSRLRARIALMLARLEGTPGAVGLDQLVEDLLPGLADPQLSANKLSRSLRAFDLAAIHTIHGFCSQVLTRFDFSTGFDPELEAVADELDYLEPLIRTGWRDLSRHFSPAFAAFVQSKNVDCMKLGRRCVQQWERPWRKVITASGNGVSSEAAESAFEEAASEFAELWVSSREQVIKLLTEATGLSKTSYKENLLQRAYELAEQVCVGKRGFKGKELDDLARLGMAKLTAACTQKSEPPEHPLFDCTDGFVAARRAVSESHEMRFRALWQELFESISDDRVSLKQQLRIRSYSDLLLNLHTALGGDQGEQLASSIAGQYPAALIDEFQDTDPAQYEILSRIYQDLEVPLIYVGDPKQALYGFRGADVFAYLEARSEVGRIRSLSSNWRAVPRLIEQLNGLFALSENPFMINDIGYKSSSAAATEKSSLMFAGETAKALDFVLLPGNEKGKGANQEDTTKQVAGQVASEIASLLARGIIGQAMIGDDKLQAADIAVLVRSHKQAQSIARALALHGVSCTQVGTSSVWRSAEAYELSLICRALDEPESRGAIAAALCTPLLGIAAVQVHELTVEEKKMDFEVSRFLEYQQLWHAHGLSAAMQQLLGDFSVSKRVLARLDGERCLTNVTHLLDLLQAHAFATGCTPGELLDWFKLQRLGAQTQAEEALLRLESDENLVQILTIHKSKGLQFPVVFCPFLWAGSSKMEQRDWIEFHQPGGTRQASLDLGGPDYSANKERSLHESFAEELRVLYVALTRAIYQCVVIWGQASGAENSPLRYLLHADADDSSWRSGSVVFKKLTAAQVRDAAVVQLEKAGIAWRFLNDIDPDQAPIMQKPEAGAGVVARQFGGQIPRSLQVHSYSSIAAHDGFGFRDHDAVGGQTQRGAREGDSLTIFDVPGGPDIGSMFHEILEELSSFGANAEEIHDLTATKSHKYGLDPVYVNPVADQLGECLLTSLNAVDPGVNLAAIKPRERIVELEFHLSLEACKLQDISRIAALRPGNGQLAKGYLRGYIDLVFCYEKQYFVVDYKSNYLGDETSAYQPDALRQAIRSSDYDLQYHLYCVAVHRFLKQRLDGYDYDLHFGGVYYLYLRGMRVANGPTTGVHFDRPDRSVIERLDQLFGA